MDKPIGTCWRHFKGGVYEITGYAFHEASNILLVVYRPLITTLHGEISIATDADSMVIQKVGDMAPWELDGLQFCRPPEEFHEKIVVECPPDLTIPATSVPRFEQVRRADCYTSLGYRG